jgi:hypothetical protein
MLAIVAAGRWPDTLRFLRRTSPGQEADYLGGVVEGRNRCIDAIAAKQIDPLKCGGGNISLLDLPSKPRRRDKGGAPDHGGRCVSGRGRLWRVSATR